jgi:hypothetical protein
MQQSMRRRSKTHVWPIRTHQNSIEHPTAHWVLRHERQTGSLDTSFAVSIHHHRHDL